METVISKEAGALLNPGSGYAFYLAFDGANNANATALAIR